MSRSIQQKDLKLLWGLSAARCNFPGCQILVTADKKGKDAAAVLGINAHICAHSSIGPRGDPTFPEIERNRYPNLILLCRHHHNLVDQQDSTYTIANLQQWKKEHEAWVIHTLVQKMPMIGFLELQIITNALVNISSEIVIDYSITDPKSKMRKNNLSDQVNFFITMGLGKSQEVHDFVQQYSTIDDDFPYKLRTGFVTEYNRLKNEENLNGDSLFFGLMEFASAGNADIMANSAGLAVLCYLFEKCEVFEK